MQVYFFLFHIFILGLERPMQVYFFLFHIFTASTLTIFVILFL